MFLGVCTDAWFCSAFRNWLFCRSLNIPEWGVLHLPKEIELVEGICTEVVPLCVPVGLLECLQLAQFGNFRDVFGNFRYTCGNFRNTFGNASCLFRVIDVSGSEEGYRVLTLQRYSHRRHSHQVFFPDNNTLQYLPIPWNEYRLSFRSHTDYVFQVPEYRKIVESGVTLSTSKP